MNYKLDDLCYIGAKQLQRLLSQGQRMCANRERVRIECVRNSQGARAPPAQPRIQSADDNISLQRESATTVPILIRWRGACSLASWRVIAWCPG